MKAFVTGATGMLGSHLVEELIASGAQVTALARAGSRKDFLSKVSVRWVTGDLLNPFSWEKELQGQDIVFHAAALMRDWAPKEEFEKHNVQATQNILEAAAKAKVKRFIHVSTRSVLGMEECSELLEGAPYRASNDYGASKIAAEKLVLEFHQQGQLDCVIIRPTWLIGPRDRYSLPAVVRYLKEGKLALINKGQALQSFVHPKDVAQALILAAKQPQASGQVYLIDSGERRTIREFYSILAKLTGAQIPSKNLPYALAYTIGTVLETIAKLKKAEQAPRLTQLRVKLLGANHSYDISKARRELGYNPRINLEEACQTALAGMNNGAKP